MELLYLFGVVAVLVLLIFWNYFRPVDNRRKKFADMTPAQRVKAEAQRVKAEAQRVKAEASRAIALFGNLSQHLICPHCQTKGTVRAKGATRVVTSTGKVGGIIKTNTKSTSTKSVTQHHCDKCSTTWDV